MKAYVYDTGWSGSEIYFAETDEEGIEYHRNKTIEASQREISRLEKLLADNLSKIPDHDRTLLEHEQNIIVYCKTKEWSDHNIEIYEVISGLSIYTQGET